MTTIPTAVWKPKANNPHYSICELMLPALASTGPLVFRHTTDLLPHNSGEVLMKAGDHKDEARVNAGQSVEIEAGTELEILNMSDQVITFTILESK